MLSAQILSVHIFRQLFLESFRIRWENRKKNIQGAFWVSNFQLKLLIFHPIVAEFHSNPLGFYVIHWVVVWNNTQLTFENKTKTRFRTHHSAESDQNDIFFVVVFNPIIYSMIFRFFDGMRLHWVTFAWIYFWKHIKTNPSNERSSKREE